jgi:hypothetical protein
MAHLQEVLTRIEPAFLLLVLIAFFRSGSARRFPAIATYIVMRVSSVLFLDCFLFGGAVPRCGTVRYTVYFYGYWVAYVACAITIFFVLQEVFKRVMEPVPGLRRLGLLAFRWVSIVSVVVSVGAIALPAAAASSNGGPLEIIALHTMRCVSVMELCLLAFMALTIHALGRSFRSRVFGIGLGFGLQAVAELIGCAMVAKYPTMSSPANLMVEIATVSVYGLWAVYFAVPEPEAERKLIVLPPNSMMARWNALANGIGQTPEPSVAPATGFFLQDIEGVVDRVLAKNPVIANR